MAIEIKGYYKLPGNAESPMINFVVVFDTSFMRKFTRYKSFEKFLNGGNFHITCQQDFEALPEKDMDKHVAKNTKFSNWQEMLDFAMDKYILRKNIYKAH